MAHELAVDKYGRFINPAAAQAWGENNRRICNHKWFRDDFSPVKREPVCCLKCGVLYKDLIVWITPLDYYDQLQWERQAFRSYGHFRVRMYDGNKTEERIEPLPIQHYVPLEPSAEWVRHSGEYYKFLKQKGDSYAP